MTLRYRYMRLLFKVFSYGFYSYRVIGRDRLVIDRPVLVAANHTSFLDPPLVGIAYRKDIWFIMRKTLLRKGLVGWIYNGLNTIPIDQERPDLAGIRAVLAKLNEGEQVLIFPEGARAWDGELQHGEAGAGMIVSRSEALVQPVRLFGAYEALPRGKGMLRPSRVTLVVGEPLDFTKMNDLPERGKGRNKAISERIMEAIGKLELPEGQ